jgi:hypothetical protein
MGKVKWLFAGMIRYECKRLPFIKFVPVRTTKTEAVSRTLCRLDGYDTEAEDKGRAMWMNYRDHARQVIEAIEGVEKEGS